jgi:outer membrane protein assembly factor BamB
MDLVGNRPFDDSLVAAQSLLMTPLRGGLLLAGVQVQIANMMKRPLSLMPRQIAIGALMVATIANTELSLLGDDWPQWRGAESRGIWSERGVVSRFNAKQLPIKWRSKIGSGYSGPTVAHERVYVTDRILSPQQTERVHCFDAESGVTLWSYTYPCAYKGVGYEAGPRAAVAIVDNLAVSLGTMGDLHCLDATSGELRWKHALGESHNIRMPIWGISASPLAYQGTVIVQIGGEEACLVCFDLQTGAEKWSALNDKASYSTPIIIQQGGENVLLCWTGENIVGLDPTSGELHWSIAQAPTNMVINVPTPVVNDNRVFFSSFYDGSTMIRFDKAEKNAELLWHRQGNSEKETDALHCMISTPLFLGDHIYGVDSYGQLRCLEADSGDRVWENLTATRTARWSNIHMVRHGEDIWMFNEEGELIIARLSTAGFEEISRTQLIEPTTVQLRQRGGVCWAHPAFANKHVFARNDKELVCASLADDN